MYRVHQDTKISVCDYIFQQIVAFWWTYNVSIKNTQE